MYKTGILYWDELIFFTIIITSTKNANEQHFIELLCFTINLTMPFEAENCIYIYLCIGFKCETFKQDLYKDINRGRKLNDFYC